jgi:hypothetical protein
MPFGTVRDAIKGVQQGRAHRQAIQRNLGAIVNLHRQAVRVTRGPAGRCFEMPDGRLLTITNEQTPGSPFRHFQYVLPISREDAEDLYGWSDA